MCAKRLEAGAGHEENALFKPLRSFSARLFHWLVRRETIERNPFDQVVFPRVGKPLIRIIEPEEFERLLLACTPSHEVGPLVDRAAARNRAILWLLYDTGIRLSELIGLRLDAFDRKRFSARFDDACLLTGQKISDTLTSSR